MYTRRVVMILLIGLLLQPGGASAWDFVWVNQFGTPLPDAAGGVAADSTGVYVVGLTLGVFQGQAASGGADAFLRKYDFGGVEIWTRQFGTPSTDTGVSVATDATGVYLSGSTRGTLPDQQSAGGFDAYIRKYSASGDVLWTRQFGTAARDVGGQVTIHASGLYLAGETNGTFPGEPNGSGADTYLAKLNPDTGELIWVRQFGVRGLPGFALTSVAVDDTGVYVASQRGSGGDVSLQRGHLHKYDFDGNLLWALEIPSLNGCAVTLWAVAAHTTGVYTVGQVSDVSFTGSSCPETRFSFGSAVGRLQKYDVNGNLLWTRKIEATPKEGEGLESFTGAKNVRVSDAGVFVSANATVPFAGQLPVGSASDRAECPAFDPSFFDQLDAYVRRYDFDGNVIWTHQFGSTRFDIATDVAMVGDSIYVAGETTCRIDPSQTFLGGDDAYVLRMAVNPTSVRGQVQLIVGRLETLNDAGLLAPADFASLVTHLEAALAALDRGSNLVAKQQLEAFVTEVGTLGSRGTLSSSEAAALVAAANAVIAQL